MTSNDEDAKAREWGRNYLLENSNLLFSKQVKPLSKDLSDKAQFIFNHYIDNILDNIFLKCTTTTTSQNGSYQLADEQGNLGINLVVTALPWTPEEAVEQFRLSSKEPDLGYTSIFMDIHNSRPSTDVYIFFHVIITMGNNILSMHLGGMPYQPRAHVVSDFTLVPNKLLNPIEKRRFNIR